MEPRRRPLGIWVIVLLQLVNAGIAIADVALGADLTGASIREIASESELLRPIVFGWAVLVVLAAVLLLSMNRRGWVLTMVLVGVSLAVHLSVWLLRPGDTQWINLALNAATAFYVNSAAVRSLFLTRHEVTRISLGGRGSR